MQNFPRAWPRQVKIRWKQIAQRRNYPAGAEPIAELELVAEAARILMPRPAERLATKPQAREQPQARALAPQLATGSPLADHQLRC